ncbi:MAG: helix-turn-helix domain-containing protein [Actinomycetota bacterium]
MTRDLSSETEKMLLRIYKESKSPQVRRRADCILLRFRGFDTEKLMIIFGVSRRTLQYWYKKWEEEKLVGLYDQMGRGRKTKLKEEQREQVREWVKQEPKHLKRVIEKIQNEWGVDVSKDTVKRILKKFEMK